MKSGYRVRGGRSVIGDAIYEGNNLRRVATLVGKSDDRTRREPIMHKKQDLKERRRTATTVIASSSSEALEQQVRENPVVQEVMRLFDARIVAVAQVGANEGDEHPVVEQQVLCFTSQEA